MIIINLLKNFYLRFSQSNFLALYLVFQTFSRVILCLYAIYFNQISILHIPLIFILGLINDLVSIVYLIPLIFLLRLIINFTNRKSFSGTTIASTIISQLKLFLFSIYIFILMFSLIAELIFWDEYGTKFNFIAVDYLIYTHEIISTLIDSIPVIPIIVVMMLCSFGISVLLKQRLIAPKTYGNHLKATQNSHISIIIIISLLLSVLFTRYYNSNSTFIFSNRYANELTLNGPYEFIKAFFTNSLNYNKFYSKLPSDFAIQLTRENIKENNTIFLDSDSTSRLINNSKQEKKYNVVLITVESLSAEFMRYFGNKKDITPNLDSLIDKSLVFNNIYAAGTRTVRGLEALTLSIPPTPGSSIIRRPQNGNLFNIGSVFRQKGYDVSFIFGGFSYFDNLLNFFSKNKFQIIDRSDLSSEEITFSNVWGVADEDILQKTLKLADTSYQAKLPFFFLVMTTSNHRPYTFPEGRIDLPSGGGRDAAVKYTDYAIGKFLEQASKKEWFEDTIFIITADHCAASAGKVNLPVDKYHIPLIIYAPKVIKPGVVDSLASQIDIPPTIFGLLNFNYKSKFFGKDILNENPNRVFISTYQLLGYMKNDNLVILAPNKEPEQYKITGKKLYKTKEDISLINDAISYYQSAYELYNNGKLANE